MYVYIDDDTKKIMTQINKDYLNDEVIPKDIKKAILNEMAIIEKNKLDKNENERIYRAIMDIRYPSKN